MHGRQKYKTYNRMKMHKCIVLYIKYITYYIGTFLCTNLFCIDVKIYIVWCVLVCVCVWTIAHPQHDSGLGATGKGRPGGTIICPGHDQEIAFNRCLRFVTEEPFFISYLAHTYARHKLWNVPDNRCAFKFLRLLTRPPRYCYPIFVHVLI